MRILLDENLDWRLRRHLPEHKLDSAENASGGEGAPN